TALELISQRDIDVAVVDVRLPDVDGLDVAEQLLRRSPAPRVILITGDFTIAALKRGVQLGVQGFVLKTESPQQMADIVRHVYRGEYRCSSRLEAQLQPGPAGFQPTFGQGAGLSALSQREREMLIALANGASLKQAATALGLTYKSADYLKQSVMKKLQ